MGRKSKVRGNGKVKGNGKVLTNMLPNSVPEPEVLAKPRRRKFTADYKLKILKEAEDLASGELGALLRREGIYYLDIVTLTLQSSIDMFYTASLEDKYHSSDLFARLQIFSSKCNCPL